MENYFDTNIKGIGLDDFEVIPFYTNHMNENVDLEDSPIRVSDFFKKVKSYSYFRDSGISTINFRSPDGKTTGKSNQDRICITSGVDFESMWLWMVVSDRGFKNELPHGEILDRMKMNLPILKFLYSSWEAGQNSDDEDDRVHPEIFHSVWTDHIRKFYTYKTESSYSDGWCGATTAVFGFLSNSRYSYPRPFAY